MNIFEITENDGIYVVGLGGYDETNAGVSDIKTVQQILVNLA